MNFVVKDTNFISMQKLHKHRFCGQRYIFKFKVKDFDLELNFLTQSSFKGT